MGDAAAGRREGARVVVAGERDGPTRGSSCCCCWRTRRAWRRCSTRRSNAPTRRAPWGKFVNRVEVKAALGARGDVEWEECSDAVGAAMHGDVMKSVKPNVEALLRGTRVLLYQGIRDLRDGVVSTEAWMRELKWDGLAAFLDADRAVWRIGEELAGYVQRSGPLSHIVVYGAGHLLPADNSHAAQEMVEIWVLQAALFRHHGGMKRAG
uniref:Serine carboxypeptidase-like 50 n=1 Tax=Oryza glumipatula TaxID=40148 RepID=A0A0E0AAY0_9ORYZ